MRFLRAVTGCSRLDRLQNKDIRNELSIRGIPEMNTYKQNSVELLQRMKNDRLPKQAFKYHTRKIYPDRPRSRWKVQDSGTGPNGANP